MTRITTALLPSMGSSSPTVDITYDDGRVAVYADGDYLYLPRLQRSHLLDPTIVRTLLEFGARAAVMPRGGERATLADAARQLETAGRDLAAALMTAAQCAHGVNGSRIDECARCLTTVDTTRGRLQGAAVIFAVEVAGGGLLKATARGDYEMEVVEPAPAAPRLAAVLEAPDDAAPSPFEDPMTGVELGGAPVPAVARCKHPSCVRPEHTQDGLHRGADGRWFAVPASDLAEGSSPTAATDAQAAAVAGGTKPRAS